MLWEVTVEVRSQREEAEFGELSRKEYKKCKNWIDVTNLLWKICFEPSLSINDNLAETPFSNISLGSYGFILEDFDFGLWEKHYATEVSIEEEEEFEEDYEFFYRGRAIAHLLVEANSEQGAADIVHAQAKDVLAFAESSSEGFYYIDEVLIESVKSAI